LSHHSSELSSQTEREDIEVEVEEEGGEEEEVEW
jgi:hypothetical protein